MSVIIVTKLKRTGNNSIIPSLSQTSHPYAPLRLKFDVSRVYAVKKKKNIVFVSTIMCLNFLNSSRCLSDPFHLFAHSRYQRLFNVKECPGQSFEIPRFFTYYSYIILVFIKIVLNLYQSYKFVFYLRVKVFI